MLQKLWYDSERTCSNLKCSSSGTKYKYKIISGLDVTLAYDVGAVHWRCTVRGGLVDSYTWMKDGVEISTSDSLYNQTLTITNRSAVTTELLFSSADNSSLLGSFTCNITDGNGRISMASQILDSK